MSTHPQRTTQTPRARTASTPPTFTTRDAPKTFDPRNTRSCPQMFADKWMAAE